MKVEATKQGDGEIVRVTSERGLNVQITEVGGELRFMVATADPHNSIAIIPTAATTFYLMEIQK